jgi:peptidoglycan/xylan/chitin deacetylase (PgdA/CDA1 family)
LRNAAASLCLPLALAENMLVRHLPILAYHRVLPAFPLGSERTGSVDPRNFALQMHYLSRHGYQTLSLGQLQRALAGDIPISHKTVVVTMDDGYADSYLMAHMIGQEHGVTINYFIPTGFISQAQPPSDATLTPQEIWHRQRFPEMWRPLTWDEVRLMIKGGAHFGCLGYLNRPVSELSLVGMEEEIARGTATFLLNLGERARFFSIPWGYPSTPTIRAIPTLKANGIELAFTRYPGRIRFPHREYLLPRITIHEHDSLAAFACKVQGAHDWLWRLARLGGMEGA